ncbi:MAG: tripartite tricarboxylate transporter TctB family protein [Desulfobacterales bacterium]|nr:tripartite tricarboxylate transporter TctB family protein [Desulfobacterales bacterium]
MKVSGRALMSLGLMVISGWVVLTSLKWPFKTALFPVAIGIPVFCMAFIDAVLNLFGKVMKTKGGSMDFQLSDDIDSALAVRRTLVIFSWILGFFLTILLLGFTVAVPAIVLFFLKIQGREEWRITIILTGSTLVFFYGLFVWILAIPFPIPLVLKALDALGIG